MAPACLLAQRRMGACETTPPATRRGRHTILHKPEPERTLPRPMIVRRSSASSSFVLAATRAAGAGPLPRGGVNRGQLRESSRRTVRAPSRRHHSSHRVKDPCPLDSGDPHGCRNTVRSVRHDVTEWRLRSWIDKYLGRRLAVMSQLIADTGHFRGRPRAAPADSPTKCFVTGRVTEDTVAAQKRRLCLRARYHWPLGMLLNVFLI